MPRRSKVSWKELDVFAVPLPDGSCAFGQAIGMMMTNVVYCALTDQRAPSVPAAPPSLLPAQVVARVALSREQLDYGAWPILGPARALCARSDFPNERFARSGYVGARIYDAALAEEFLAAFHALACWDAFHDPTYLDQWLVSPSRKPARLLFKSTAKSSN